MLRLPADDQYATYPEMRNAWQGNIRCRLYSNSDGPYDLVALVMVHVSQASGLAYVSYCFRPGQFRLGATGALLTDVGTTYNHVLVEHPDLPRLCDRVFFDIPEPLSGEDLAATNDHARRLGIDLVVRQG